MITALNFIVQMLGMTVLAMAATPILLYLGCVLFGLGSGQTAFDRRHAIRGAGGVAFVMRRPFTSISLLHP
jgi:hypothetical protein